MQPDADALRPVGIGTTMGPDPEHTALIIVARAADVQAAADRVALMLVSRGWRPCTEDLSRPTRVTVLRVSADVCRSGWVWHQSATGGPGGIATICLDPPSNWGSVHLNVSDSELVDAIVKAVVRERRELGLHVRWWYGA